MQKILNPFEKLLVGLVDAEVRFVTVGGLACAFNGFLRATEDVDLLIRNSPENIARILDFLSKYEEGFGRELKPEDFADEEGAIRILEEFPIDLFTVMSGKHFEDFKDNIRFVDIAGRSIAYLDREALIDLKKGSLREKDQIDVLALKKLQD